MENNKFMFHLEEYKSVRDISTSRIRQDLVKEYQTSSEYRGREIYELLQNAEDAKASFVSITLNTESKTLVVANGGDGCEGFSDDGFCSIMMSDMSPKANSTEKYIGCKGLGFRSLINWAESIIVRSSGKELRFSRDIAKGIWQDHIVKEIGEPLASKHKDFALKQYGCDCPLAMLSIPEINVWSSSRESVTEIEVRYKDSVEKSIQDQINTLTGKELLFLRNINKIDLFVNNTKKSIVIKRDTSNNKAIINADGQTFEWSVYKNNGKIECPVGDTSEEKNYEVSIAYSENAFLNYDAIKGDYVYCYFPTKVYLNLPFLLHATFDVNLSRNGLVVSEENDIMQKKIAETISDLVMKLVKEKRIFGWAYYDFLNVTDETDRRTFPILSNELDQYKEKLPIFPVIAGNYKISSETCHYSEIFSEYCNKNTKSVKSQFGNLLLPGFAGRGIREKNGDVDFCNNIDLVSKNLTSDDGNIISQRADFIMAVTSVQNSANKKMAILIDDKYNVIDSNKQALINSGLQIPDLPEDLEINYVNDDLVRLIIDKIGTTEKKVTKGVSDYLSPYVAVSYSDITAIKNKIISYSRSNMNKEGYLQLMSAIFNLYWKDKTTDGGTQLASIFDDYQMRVLNSNGQKVQPSDVLLSSQYSNQFYICTPQDGWCQFFDKDKSKCIKDADIEDFFYNVVGVAQHVPLKKVAISQKEDKNFLDIINKDKQMHLWRYESDSPDSSVKKLNVVSILDKTFVESYLNSNNTISGLVSLIAADKRAKDALSKKELSYYNRCEKIETFSLGYASYMAQQIEKLKPLSSFVVSDKLCLTDPDFDMSDIDLEDKDILSILISLGAKERLSDLTIEELYVIMESLPVKNLKSGIQAIYKSIREAINIKRNKSEELRKVCDSCADKFRENGKVYVKQYGEIKIVSVKEAFYWDNEQLPKKILSGKCKLEIGHRVGETSVKEIFGVKLAKDITLDIVTAELTKNEAITVALEKYLRERNRYVLAYRINNKDVKDVDKLASSLKKLNIVVAENCSVKVDEDLIELSASEMINKGDDFYLCYKGQSFDAAIKDPSFCSVIAEILCIQFNLVGNEMMSCFREIIKSPIIDIEYNSKREISEDNWTKVDRALGLSDNEKLFWQKVFEKKDKVYEESKLTEGAYQKVIYLKSVFDVIKLPNKLSDIMELSNREKFDLLFSLFGDADVQDCISLLGECWLMDYYRSELESLQLQFKLPYSKFIYERCNSQPNSSQNYSDAIAKYENYNWIDKAIEGIGNRMTKDLQSVFADAFYNAFGTKYSDIDKDVQSWHLAIMEGYQTILNKYSIDISELDRKDLFLAYFPGNEKEFEKAVTDKCDKQEQPTGQGQGSESLKIAFGSWQKVLNKEGKRSGYRGTNPNQSGYISERAKQKAGRAAEKKVYDAMCADKEHFRDVVPISKNLNPMGDDSKHYDIQYRLMDSDEIHYLEVKNMSSDFILMSSGEYEFGHNNQKVYDIAVVVGDELTIIPAPFYGGEENNPRPKLEGFTDTYKIPLKVVNR